MKRKIGIGIGIITMILLLGSTIDFFLYAPIEKKEPEKEIVEKKENKVEKYTIVETKKEIEKKEEEKPVEIETKVETEEKLQMEEEISSTGTSQSLPSQTPTIKEENSIVVESGKSVSFQRIRKGIQIQDLTEKERNYAEELLSIVLSSQEKEVVLDWDCTYEEYERIIEALDNTYCPYDQFFYTSYTNLGKPIYKVNVPDSREAYERNQILEVKIKEMVNAWITPSMTEKEAVQKLNEEIGKLLTYNLQYGDIYDALATGQGRCSSYALLMEAMCNYIGIECDFVEGWAMAGWTGWGAHAWNRVKIGTTWYYIDCCWNDETGNQYLLSETLWNDHKI